MKASGLNMEIFSGGGTGTYNIMTKVPGFTDVQVGSYVFMDAQYLEIGNERGEIFTDFEARKRACHAEARKREGGWHGCCMACLMTNFFVYMIGVVLVVGALAYGASLLGLNSTWVAIVALVGVGLGVMGAIVKTRQKEPS